MSQVRSNPRNSCGRFSTRFTLVSKRNLEVLSRGILVPGSIFIKDAPPPPEHPVHFTRQKKKVMNGYLWYRDCTITDKRDNYNDF